MVQMTLTYEERERIRLEVARWGLEQAGRGWPLSATELEAELESRLRAAERVRSAPKPSGPVLPFPGAVPVDDTAEGRRLSRRRVLKTLGLAGIPALVAFTAAKMTTPTAAAASSPDPNGLGGSSGPDSDPVAAKIDQPALALQNRGATLYSPFPGAVAKPYPNHLDRLIPPPPLPAQAGRLREFTVSAVNKTIEIANGVHWAGWTFDGTIPGPVIRVTQGDQVRVTLKNQTDHPHSIHFHSIHPANQDGVFQLVPAGGQGTYEFVADPFGVFPYHCHVDPLDQHVARGLYGVLIIDPPQPRPPAQEFVFLMNGFDLNFDKSNELYSINGLPGYYNENPIELKVNQLVRVYLVNMTEFDPVNSFHLHANMFHWYPHGTSLEPSALLDVVHLGIADRGILEFSYKYPGQYLFHAHQTELTILGWTAKFNVTA